MLDSYVQLISHLLFIDNPLFTGIFLSHMYLNWFQMMASFMRRNM